MSHAKQIPNREEYHDWPLVVEFDAASATEIRNAIRTLEEIETADLFPFIDEELSISKGGNAAAILAICRQWQELRRRQTVLGLPVYTLADLSRK